VRVDVAGGSGVEIRCDDERVPTDASNTCHKIAERVLEAAAPGLKPGDVNSGLDASLKARSTKIKIEIEKRLPVQGGLGAASSNAVATILAMERALGVSLTPADKLRIAAEVGSDLPLFLIGGTVLGVGRGEEVYPLPDLPPLHVVVVTPPIGVSTPWAFARWDELSACESSLTAAQGASTINEFSKRVFSWLSARFPQASAKAGLASGVPAWGGDRAETLLLDLVRAGIENDFERVVFPEYPELREVKELLLREGARYASLSGSGSTLYGLFASEAAAGQAAERMSAAGHKAIATKTLSRAEYWRALVSG
jgi:4-diphosphocytidyl-2-C-methyl-D-erythritol kinase